MQISYGSAIVRQNLKKIQSRGKHAVQIVFNVNKKTHARPLFQEINAVNIYQINLLQVLVFMQRIKISTFPMVFLTYFQPINDTYETRFSKHNFKQSDVF